MLFPNATVILNNKVFTLFLCHIGSGIPFCVTDANAGHGPIAGGLNGKTSILHTLAEANRTVYHLVWHGCDIDDIFKGYDHLIENMSIAFDAISPDPINTVALCQGGPVLLRYAARNPHRVARIVTVNSPLNMGDLTGCAIKDAIELDIWNYSFVASVMGGAVPCQLMVDSWNNLDAEKHASARLDPKNAPLYDWFDKPNTDAKGKPGMIGHWQFGAVWAMQHDTFMENNVYERGEHIDLMAIKHIPMAFVGSRKDEIVTVNMAHPVGACWVNDDALFIENPGGHIGGFAGKDSQPGIARACDI